MPDGHQSPSPGEDGHQTDLSPMDRAIPRRILTKNRIVTGLTGVALLSLGAVALIVLQDKTKTYALNAERVTVAEVRMGTFLDDIPVRGQVTPLTTVYLDSVEGGQVTEVLAEEGAFVTAGEPIVALKNTDLQLEVIGREAQVTEQLNNLRNTSLALEQNRLAHERDLIEINYQVARVTRLLDRRRPLLASGAISRQDIEELEDELDYLESRRTVTLAAQTQDEVFRTAQVEQLEDSIESLRDNLTIARANLANLVIRAPIDGQLTSLDAHVGESKARGQRLGQIDQVDRYKVSAWVDEFYLTRVAQGQTANFLINSERFDLAVTKIYPEVVSGQFRADLAFDGPAPDGLRRGQTVQLRLALDAPTQSLVIDNGPFYQETGGTWVFVIDPVSGDATRRPVKLGRRTTRQIEVLEGLSDGHRIVTSSYESFADMDRLVFDR